jgi:hypothetical protein
MVFFLPCHLYRSPIDQEIHIDHFQSMPGHAEHIHRQRRAGTGLYYQMRLVISDYVDVKAYQLPSVDENVETPENKNCLPIYR